MGHDLGEGTSRAPRRSVRRQHRRGSRPGRRGANCEVGPFTQLRAGTVLEEVTAPTLLIVGSEDPVVVEVNREAFGSLRGEKRLEVIPGAGHLFEEPGALERVAGLAADWFLRHF